MDLDLFGEFLKDSRDPWDENHLDKPRFGEYMFFSNHQKSKSK